MSKAASSYALAPTSVQDPMCFLFDGLEVRAVDRGGRPWFVGKDVCRVLGHINKKDALSRLPDAERATVKIPDALGRQQNTTIISIAGVFRLAMTSRVDGADRFRSWVTDEVLPQIYTRGTYAAPSSPFTLTTREADLSALVDQVATLADQVAMLRAQALPATTAPGPTYSLPMPQQVTFGEWSLVPKKFLGETNPMYATATGAPTICMSPAWFRRYISGDPDVRSALCAWVDSFPPRPWTDLN